MKSCMRGVLDRTRDHHNRELIPGLMQCQWAVGFSGKAQHFGRKTVEQCTQPAQLMSTGATVGRPCAETAVLVFLPAAQGRGRCGQFHLPVSRIAFMDFGDLDLTDGWYFRALVRAPGGPRSRSDFSCAHEPRRARFA